MNIKYPIIINYGRKIWVDTAEYLREIWSFNIDNGIVKYNAASKSYPLSDEYKYQFHWFIDSDANLFVIEHTGSENNWGKFFGFKRFIGKVNQPKKIKIREFLLLLSKIDDDEEYRDKTILTQAVSKHFEDDELCKYMLSDYMQ